MSATETAWTIVGDEFTASHTPESLAWPSEGNGSETRSDEAIARMLQREERRPWLVHFPAPPFGKSSSSSRCLDRGCQEALEERLGVCVICSESVATVIMEPCGHLAMCARCHAGWARHSSTCALCRTPGEGVHLLVGSSHAVDVCLLDGRLSVPSLEPEPEPRSSRPSPKLTRRRELRRLTREAHASGGGGSVGWEGRGGPERPWGRSDRAGGRFAVKAAEAAARREWEEHERRMRCWNEFRRSVRTLLRSATATMADVLAKAPGPLGCERRWRSLQRTWMGFDAADVQLSPVSRKYARTLRSKLDGSSSQLGGPSGGFRGDCTNYNNYYWDCRSIGHFQSGEGSRAHRRRTASEKRDLGRDAELEGRRRADERRERREQAAKARVEAEAAVSAAAEAARAPKRCAECGERESQMMALPCQHAALCRSCWEGTAERSRCARCSALCEVVLCVHRP